MLDTLISFMVIIYAVSLFIAPVMLFSIRLHIVLNNKSDFKKSLMILFIPGSVGLYLHYGKYDKILKLYESLVIIIFFLTFIGSIYILYTYLG